MLLQAAPGLLVRDLRARPQCQQNITCSPNPCPVLGACCNPVTGDCTLQSSSTTCGGPWFAGLPCQPNACVRGGCCNTLGGSCLITSQAACAAHGLSWLGAGIACSPPLCPSTTGACCVTGQIACTITTRSACTGAYLAGTTCAPNPCCHADFNGSGQVSVQDFFDYLGAWFVGCH